jgi:hypothetical protein
LNRRKGEKRKHIGCFLPFSPLLFIIFLVDGDVVGLWTTLRVRCGHGVSELPCVQARSRLPQYLLLSLSQQVAGVGTQGPDVIGSDGSYLADTRTRLGKRDGSLDAALRALEADAKKALTLAPASVMDKMVVPPSGDKHDYMSQAPYWWPDPSSPDGRPYVRRDGERNPEINRIPDHDNLGRLTSAVFTLGLAFYYTGREEYSRHAARLVRTWFLDPATRMNPHLRFWTRHPWHYRGAWYRDHRDSRFT